MVSWVESYRHRGSHVLWSTWWRTHCESVVNIGFVLQFMGTVEESLMTGQIKTRVRYMD